MSNARTNLIVVGAGPAGIAAAVMAVSLGQTVRLIEADKPGGKLHYIGALNNVPGNWTTGSDLAAALDADLERAEATNLLSRSTGRATAVAGHDDYAEVTLDDGTVHQADAVVVATGVRTLQPADAPWLDYPDRLPLPPLWRANPDHFQENGQDLEMVVLGGDRPLGTWLRSHPHTDIAVRVLYPPVDEYKVAEVADDPRVQLLRVDKVSISSGAAYGITTDLSEGPTRMFSSWNVLGNLGNRPAALDGLVQGPDGYCPPEEQHPRVLIAGDLRSARFQRIVTAQGSGAQAALTRYYDSAFMGA